MTWDEKILRSIIRECILKGRLFELIFSDDGQRLWQSWPTERFRRIVREEIGKVKSDS